MSATYLLHLADNALILGQRNAEWCGHGPVLEEDIAMANNSLDLIGQARLLYQRAAELLGQGATEDSLAYFRDAPDFLNYTLLELPHSNALLPTASSERDFATTIVRNFCTAPSWCWFGTNCKNLKTVSWPLSQPSRSKKFATTCATRVTGWCAWVTARLSRTHVHKTR